MKEEIIYRRLLYHVFNFKLTFYEVSPDSLSSLFCLLLLGHEYTMRNLVKTLVGMNQTLPIIRRISNSFKGRIPVKDLVVHTESDEVPRVEVKLRIDGVDWIDETVKKCLKEQYAHRVNKYVLIFHSGTSKRSYFEYKNGF